ncbi:hypothetical protein L6Q96_17350 [Candidatus Binatia bacterium]|nr:hypothetical protein [Candidatus Binatia bacterium]
MQTVTCRQCGTTLDEAHQDWDRALKTGACPGCGALFDQAREQQAQTIAHNPTLRAKTNRVRLVALLVGAVLLVAAALAGNLWIMVLAVIELAFAALYRPADAARQSLHRKTDLDRFAGR